MKCSVGIKDTPSSGMRFFGEAKSLAGTKLRFSRTKNAAMLFSSKSEAIFVVEDSDVFKALYGKLYFYYPELRKYELWMEVGG